MKYIHRSCRVVIWRENPWTNWRTSSENQTPSRNWTSAVSIQDQITSHACGNKIALKNELKKIKKWVMNAEPLFKIKITFCIKQNII